MTDGLTDCSPPSTAHAIAHPLKHEALRATCACRGRRGVPVGHGQESSERWCGGGGAWLRACAYVGCAAAARLLVAAGAAEDEGAADDAGDEDGDVEAQDREDQHRCRPALHVIERSGAHLDGVSDWVERRLTRDGIRGRAHGLSENEDAGELDQHFATPLLAMSPVPPRVQRPRALPA